MAVDASDGSYRGRHVREVDPFELLPTHEKAQRVIQAIRTAEKGAVGEIPGPWLEVLARIRNSVESIERDLSREQ